MIITNSYNRLYTSNNIIVGKHFRFLIKGNKASTASTAIQVTFAKNFESMRA